MVSVALQSDTHTGPILKADTVCELLRGSSQTRKLATWGGSTRGSRVPWVIVSSFWIWFPPRESSFLVALPMVTPDEPDELWPHIKDAGTMCWSASVSPLPPSSLRPATHRTHSILRTAPAPLRGRKWALVMRPGDRICRWPWQCPRLSGDKQEPSGNSYLKNKELRAQLHWPLHHSLLCGF